MRTEIENRGNRDAGCCQYPQMEVRLRHKALPNRLFDKLGIPRLVSDFNPSNRPDPRAGWFGRDVAP